MAAEPAIYDAHEILDEAGVVEGEGLADRLRLLVAERDQLRHLLLAGQCLRMAAWCIQEGRDYDAYRMLAIAQRPELADEVPESDHA